MTVPPEAGAHDYRELAPPPALAGVLACVWTQTAGPAGRHHRVLPDGCADIVWLAGERLVVAGTATGPELVALPPGSSTLGVRFRPGAAGRVLGLPASELLNQGPPLEAVWGPAGRRLAERVGEATDPARALAALEAAVAARLDRAGPPDRLVEAVADRLAGPVPVPVARLAADLGLSERQLLRRCRDAVGYGPKTLARVLRFRRLLRLAEGNHGRGLAELAAAAGYADQAHLSRETVRLAGLPPARLLAQQGMSQPGMSDSFKPPATVV
jgi:AraC-like DNA-binding protein